jgi:isopentenyl-diphosphate Delta-isomerase
MGNLAQVILVDESGAAIGTAVKREVHDRHTPLHLAFSCYLVSPSGRILLTPTGGAKADLARCLDE